MFALLCNLLFVGKNKVQIELFFFFTRLIYALCFKLISHFEGFVNLFAEGKRIRPTAFCLCHFSWLIVVSSWMKTETFEITISVRVRNYLRYHACVNFWHDVDQCETNCPKEPWYSTTIFEILKFWMIKFDYAVGCFYED